MTRWWVRWDDGTTATFVRCLTQIADQYSEGSIKDRIIMAIKKRHGTSDSRQTQSGIDVCDLAVRYIAVYEFITEVTYENGEVRVPGSMTMFAATDGGLRLCLNDKDTDEVAFVSGSTWTSVLDRANEALQAGTLDWRSGVRGGKGKRK